jgi:hypothetical protein
LNTLLHLSSSSPLPQLLEHFQHVFLHLHACVHIICTAFILLPLALWPPSPIIANHPTLQFCRRKNIKNEKKNNTFLLVWDKDSYTGGCFIAYMYYNPNWVISSSPLHASLVPIPWWPQPV